MNFLCYLFILSTLIFFWTSQFIQRSGQFFILFRIQVGISIQCGFYRLIPQSFRNLQGIKPHLNQHTGVAVPYEIKTFGFPPTFTCIAAYQHGSSAVPIGNRVGHESVDVTYRYAHMFPKEQTQMAKLLNEEFHEK